MKLFHRHKFDPDKWEIVSQVPLVKQRLSMGVPIGEEIPMGLHRVYKNACLNCGDLVFRRVTEIEQ